MVIENIQCGFCKEIVDLEILSMKLQDNVMVFEVACTKCKATFKLLADVEFKNIRATFD